MMLWSFISFFILDLVLEGKIEKFPGDLRIKIDRIMGAWIHEWL